MTDGLLTDVAPGPLLVTHGTADYIFTPESVLADTVSEGNADPGVPKRFETLFSTAVTSSPRGLLERLDWLDRQFDRYYWVFRWEN